MTAETQRVHCTAASLSHHAFNSLTVTVTVVSRPSVMPASTFAFLISSYLAVWVAYSACAVCKGCST